MSHFSSWSVSRTGRRPTVFTFTGTSTLPYPGFSNRSRTDSPSLIRCLSGWAPVSPITIPVRAFVTFTPTGIEVISRG
jgi:hypothetical protein